MSKIRLAIGVVSAVFSVYLLLGLFGKNELRIVSGFPPPKFYSIFPYEDPQIIFKDFEEGVAYAKQHNKPILLDFTGWACMNCRKMEDNVWTDPQVKTLMEEFVLISLYVDDNENELPQDKQFDFKLPTGRVKPIKTVGAKWATFQTVNFQTASQPYYVLMNADYEVLAPSQQYVGVDVYRQWLENGLARFKQK